MIEIFSLFFLWIIFFLREIIAQKNLKENYYRLIKNYIYFNGKKIVYNLINIKE